MFTRFAILLCALVALTAATDVLRCTDNKPFPLAVRVDGCEVPPCDIIKGKNVRFEIDLVSYKFITKMTTKVRATTFGVTVPYVLPEDVADVCRNLLYGAYCPLYPTEDVTYLFVFPVGNYPEVSVRVEIYVVDQDEDVTTCFLCDIKVKSGPTRNSTVYQINYLNN